jgi:hypothetical protein
VNGCLRHPKQSVPETPHHDVVILHLYNRAAMDFSTMFLQKNEFVEICSTMLCTFMLCVGIYSSPPRCSSSAHHTLGNAGETALEVRPSFDTICKTLATPTTALFHREITFALNASLRDRDRPTKQSWCWNGPCFTNCVMSRPQAGQARTSE